MYVSRAALIAILVGLTLLVSPALLLQYHEEECSYSVDPATDTADSEEHVRVIQYDDLSSDAKRAFDRAQATDHSVTGYGEQCPDEFSYSGSHGTQYEIAKDGTRYVLTAYPGTLLPKVPIASGVLAYLGLGILGIGLATRDDPWTQFPAWIGAVGLATLTVVTAAVVLERNLWLAVGVTIAVTCGTFLSAGAALQPRRALRIGVALALLPAVASLPLLSVSIVFLAPAALVFLLVGVGIAASKITAYVRTGGRGTIR